MQPFIDTEKIHDVLKIHHETVRKSHEPVMTVLIGSQNYGLSTEKSDYDTFTFVLPTKRSIALAETPVSYKIEDEYGHINVKDIRLALNLLKKTNPNSVECFSTKYRITEPAYENMIEISPIMLRCDTMHMLSTIGGLAHQLAKRNMAPGKQLAHILRMECMIERYFDINSDILSMTEEKQEKAFAAKQDPLKDEWIAECAVQEKNVQEAIKKANVNYFAQYETFANKCVESIAENIMEKIYS